MQVGIHLEELMARGEGYLMDYKGMLQERNSKQQLVESGLNELLEEFNYLFGEPTRLPHRRDHDYAIRLLPNAQHQHPTLPLPPFLKG